MLVGFDSSVIIMLACPFACTNAQIPCLVGRCFLAKFGSTGVCFGGRKVAFVFSHVSFIVIYAFDLCFSFIEEFFGAISLDEINYNSDKIKINYMEYI